MENEFGSEKKGSRVPSCTRKEYSEILAIHYATDDRDKAKAQKEYRERGTKKYISNGTMDRLSAKPYDFISIDPKKASSDINNLTGDERSYYYGYYILASEKIAMQIKYPSIVRLAPIGEIGYNDAQDSNISLEDLPEEIKGSKEYLEGYKEGLEAKVRRNKTK